MKKNPIHPAVFSDPLLPHFVEILRSEFGDTVETLFAIDPCAGLGVKFAEVCRQVGLIPVGVEIERGYFEAGATHPCVVQGDSRDLQFPDGTFSAGLTSPVYPNGMADDFIALDGSPRHTYVHHMREHMGSDYMLAPGNTASLNPRRSPKAYAVFQQVTSAIWLETRRVLQDGSIFVVNAKDTPRYEFVADCKAMLERTGFTIEREVEVPVKGNNHGKNYEVKAKTESIIVARAA